MRYQGNSCHYPIFVFLSSSLPNKTPVSSNQVSIRTSQQHYMKHWMRKSFQKFKLDIIEGLS